MIFLSPIGRIPVYGFKNTADKDSDVYNLLPDSQRFIESQEDFTDDTENASTYRPCTKTRFRLSAAISIEL
jgi:hypothetical protein